MSNLHTEPHRNPAARLVDGSPPLPRGGRQMYNSELFYQIYFGYLSKIK
jgi:hypothetical protein